MWDPLCGAGLIVSVPVENIKLCPLRSPHFDGDFALEYTFYLLVIQCAHARPRQSGALVRGSPIGSG